MDRIEWLKWRRKGIGASDVYVLLGLALKWATPLSLYEDKISTEEPVDETNFAAERGNKAEPAIRALFELLKGKTFKEALVQHEVVEYLRASLDGLTEDGEEIAEFKLLNEADWLLAKNDKVVPPKYFSQMQYQLAVKGAKKNYFVAYKFGAYKYGMPLTLENLAIVEVDPDKEYQEKILVAVQNFWENHVLKRKPPKETEADWKEVKKDKEDLSAKLKKAMADLKLREKLVKDIKEEMKKRVEEVKHKRVKYGDFKWTSVTKKGNIDYALIPELKGVETDKYRKPSTTYWKMT